MDSVPNKIGKYSIESLIAQGGMGAVYKGVHPTLNRYVILKKLTLGNNQQFIDRFNREARIMMDFKNDNIVDVYDHFIEDDDYYIVLEYVDGISLDKFIQTERYLTNELALYIILQISNALKYAHDKNVIHRDIKPANILLSKEGDVKLVDFGIAVSDKESEDDLTKEGITLGTPSYMAPEQFKNSKNVDNRADIYSVGVILYEMITGKKPFPSGFSQEAIIQIQKGRYKSPKKINPNVNKKTLMLIKKMMSAKPKRRVQDLDYVINSLRKNYKSVVDPIYKSQITDLIKGDPIKEISVKKKKIKIPIIITLVLLVLVSIRLNQNPLRFLVGKDLGIIEFNLKVDSSYYKKPEDIYINSRLYLESGNKLEFIKNKEINFNVLDSENNSFTLNSGKCYLPAGSYRLKVIADGNLFWNNFNIYGKEIIKKDLFIRKQAPLTLVPYINVYNGITGENITNSVMVSIKQNNIYIPYIKEENELKTDSIQFFKCEKIGYETKEFILKIESNLTNLTLNIEMLKIEKENNSDNKN